MYIWRVFKTKLSITWARGSFRWSRQANTHTGIITRSWFSRHYHKYESKTMIRVSDTWCKCLPSKKQMAIKKEFGFEPSAGAAPWPASVSETKQQFRATLCKAINTHNWQIGNRYRTLDGAITLLRISASFPATFVLILPPLSEDNLARSRPILPILCYYCPPQAQSGYRSNFPSQSGDVYWQHRQECWTAAAGL